MPVADCENGRMKIRVYTIKLHTATIINLIEIKFQKFQ